MRVLFTGLMCLALAGGAWAQRGGARGGGGGMRGGMGGGFHGGSMGGFHGGGGFTGVRGGFGGVRGGIGGFHNGFSGYRGFNGYHGWGGYRGFGGWGGWGLGYGGWGLGYGGWGFGLGFGYSDWPYYSSYPYLGTYPYLGGYYGGSYDPGYAYAAPATTVVYAPPASAPPVYVVPQPERANPVTHEYDQFGQEVRPRGAAAARSSSPIYLFAFQDHVIRAANAYWVDGRTLHYVTLQHEEKQAPVDTLDRGLTLQLNRERQIPIQLP